MFSIPVGNPGIDIFVLKPRSILEVDFLNLCIY